MKKLYIYIKDYSIMDQNYNIYLTIMMFRNMKS